MDTSTIQSYFKTLPIIEQDRLLSTLSAIKTNKSLGLIDIREANFNEKQEVCPHCQNKKYVKMGKDKGVQRYKCKSCHRTFTPYTGTWMAQIHKKDILANYLKLMQQGLSLDKIKEKLNINKKTAFDWRHKISQSIKEADKDLFIGITESDETFFLHSEKGSGKLTRKSRKRGKQIKTKGISKEQVAVIATKDRKGAIALTASCFGRISKKDIANAIGKRTTEQTILCSDGHMSFKGFAIDNNIEHHILKANLKQFVKKGTFHIQNINSLHSRLKSWINKDLYGVSTKYLQNYLNWFHLKEKFKNENQLQNILLLSLANTNARAEYLYATKNIYNNKTTLF